MHKDINKPKGFSGKATGKHSDIIIDDYPDDGGCINLRDYFAAKAMQGLITSIFTETTATENHHLFDKFEEIYGNGTTEQYIAKYSYELADAMLEARDK